ncbi:MAG: ParB/RepB/Spo0J family partition protein [Anaerovoracaceae bacterium]
MNNNFRPTSLGAVAAQTKPQDLGIKQRVGLLKGLTSDGAQMNNTDNYKNVDLDSLVEFKGHPFQVRDDAEMLELVESIKESGVMEAILVRPIEDDKYEILAGHRRATAARKAGLFEIPARVLNVDDETAVIIMTNTNLKRREKILPSERAKAYKMQLDAYKCQGKRRDLLEAVNKENFGANCTQVDAGNFGANCTQVKSRDIVAKLNDTTAHQISRYIRLLNLIVPILDKVDSEEIPFMAGVALSFLAKEEQQIVLDAMDNGVIKKMDLKLAEELKSISKKSPGQLNEAVIVQMLAKDNKNETQTAYKVFQNAARKALNHFKKSDYSNRAGSDIDPQELEQVIIEAIQKYAENK